jgi:glucose/arabinose dehydrogenase
MKLIRRLFIPTLIVLLLCACVLGVVAPHVAGLAIDYNFIVGLVRGALSRDTGENITAPPGFVVSVYADGLTNPTALAVGPEGSMYVAQLNGQIIVLDGTPLRRLYASGFIAPLGMVWRGDELYVASRGKVSIVSPDKRVRDIITGLPAARHQTDGMAFGRDGKLYIGQGSRSDHGEVVGIDPLEATVLVVDADAAHVENLRVFAKGLRNPYRIAFHPETGELFATDNGKDVPGEGVPDELNVVVEGAHYGWPDCYGVNLGANCAGTKPSIVYFPEHSSANGLVFYTGNSFPAEYRNNLFVALYGSNSGDPLIGRTIERVILTKQGDGWRGAVSAFAKGFKNPLDLTVGNDGALYVADFGTGKVYRITWGK